MQTFASLWVFRLRHRFCRRCIRLFFCWRVTVEEVRAVRGRVSSFDLVELSAKFPRSVSCQFFLVLGPMFAQLVEIWRGWQTFVPYIFCEALRLGVGSWKKEATYNVVTDQ